jgi:hypothetical protein
MWAPDLLLLRGPHHFREGQMWSNIFLLSFCLGVISPLGSSPLCPPLGIYIPPVGVKSSRPTHFRVVLVYICCMVLSGCVCAVLASHASATFVVGVAGKFHKKGR